MKTYAAPLMALILLSACSRKEPPAPPAAAPVAQAPVAAKPATAPAAEDPYAPLMRAVFGSRYRPEQGNALAPLPDPWVDGMQTPLLLTGIASTRLPSGVTVLAVAGEDVDNNGDPDSSLGQPAYLSLYLLREEGGQWRVLRRHENVAKLGSEGHVGKVSWVALGPGRPGLAIESRVANRGQANDQLSLFDPAAEKVVLADGILIHSDNDDDCGDYRPKCWNNTAKWQLDSASGATPYHDLVLTIESKLRNAKPGAIEAAEQAGNDEIARDEWTGQSTARYVFADGQYRLREGRNEIEPE
jgi:hypothetical protein